MPKKPVKGASGKDILLDVVGFWSEIKLEIVRKYLPAYTTVLCNQRIPFKTFYIDAFAGSGYHLSKKTGDVVKGSPIIALETNPPFGEYHFIDLDETKVSELEALASKRRNVTVHHGDCNTILTKQILPRVRYEDYRRAVCFLDPYNLQVDWSVVAAAGQMKTIELFLNFPLLAINRNVLRHDPSSVSDANRERMNRFWGDDSWRRVGYQEIPTLFGTTEEKIESRDLASVYRDRLRRVAGFSYVPQPMAMKNSLGNVLYYLFFASYNRTGGKIVADIFERFRKRGYG